VIIADDQAEVAGRRTNPHGLTCDHARDEALPNGFFVAEDSIRQRCGGRQGLRLDERSRDTEVRAAPRDFRPSTPSVRPAASQLPCLAVIGRPFRRHSPPRLNVRNGWMSAMRFPLLADTGPPWLTDGPRHGTRRARGPNSM